MRTSLSHPACLLGAAVFLAVSPHVAAQPSGPPQGIPGPAAAKQGLGMARQGFNLGMGQALRGIGNAPPQAQEFAQLGLGIAQQAFDLGINQAQNGLTRAEQGFQNGLAQAEQGMANAARGQTIGQAGVNPARGANRPVAPPKPPRR